MAITSLATRRLGNVTVVTATSDRTPPVYFFWFADGAFAGMTSAGERSFWVHADEQIRVDVIDQNDPAWDYVAGAPAGYPAKRLLWWTSNEAGDVARYRLEQQRASDPWEAIAELKVQPGQWTFDALSGRLDDLTVYGWRLVSVDAVGNESVAAAMGVTQTIVRTPDAPNWTLTYSPATRQITLEAA